MSDRSHDYGVVGNAPTTDVVPVLLQILGGVQQEPQRIVDAVPPEELEIRRREVKQWKQWAAARGADSARFRREVRRAYNSTCVVCGLRLPSIGSNSNPGVDAAHILPWTAFDLDQVSNGLCLCKLHHWAFDECLIELTFENGGYSIVIPDAARAAIGESGEDVSLAFLEQHTGLIPAHRLPLRPADRPNPQFLRLLREYLESNAAS
ncbi:MAG: HNH endonuclease [Thermoguttaceae bacterium]